MQSHRLTTYAGIVLLASAAGLMTACAPVRDYDGPVRIYSPRPAFYDYWYYPAIGSYYDPRARLYLYSENDRWIRARQLPVRVRPYLGRYVVIRSAHERPYEENLRHRERYAPEKYRPARDKKKVQPYERDNDTWIGAPQPPRREQDRDQRRRIDSDDRNRNAGTVKREAGRGSAVPALQRRGEPLQRRSREPADARTQDAPRRSESPDLAAPVRQRADGGRDTRGEPVRDQARGSAERREDRRQRVERDQRDNGRQRDGRDRRDEGRQRDPDDDDADSGRGWRGQRSGYPYDR